MRYIALFAALSLAVPLGAQDETATAKTGTNTLAWHSQQQAYLSGLKTSDGWYWEEGGVRWRYLEYKGSQTKPSVEDTVTIHYEGKLVDGTVFDSSYQRGEPATFPLSRLIEGWQIAIPQMGIGDTIEIAIPADRGYGPRGGGPIPGNATLIFKVELFGIKK